MSVPTTVDSLIQAAEQLTPHELAMLTDRVVALRAQRAAPSVSRKEAELLQRIAIRMPDAHEVRYRELIKRRDAEQLTAADHQELMKLTEEAESVDVQRVQAISELAHLRGTSLPELLEQLDLPHLNE